jgi:hypothetical protein
MAEEKIKSPLLFDTVSRAFNPGKNIVRKNMLKLG